MTANRKNLERVTREATTDLGLDPTIEKVEDYPTIAAYGIMSTPALVVDEEVLVYGRVPKVAELRSLLTPGDPIAAAPWVPPPRTSLGRRGLRALISAGIRARA